MKFYSQGGNKWSSTLFPTNEEKLDCRLKIDSKTAAQMVPWWLLTMAQMEDFLVNLAGSLRSTPHCSN